MRRCMTILAIVATLAGFSLCMADDPFDFSAPMSGSTPRRTAQYFSRDIATQGDSATAESAVQSAAYRRTSQRSDSGFSIDGESPKASSEFPGRVSFGQELARERKEQKQADSNQALERFDEFLKTRAVVEAEYTELSAQESSPKIRQVQMGPEDSLDDLPTFGNLDDATPSRGARTLPRSEPAAEIDSAASRAQSDPSSLFGEPTSPPQTAPQSDRLTDPISTQPSAGSDVDTQVDIFGKQSDGGFNNLPGSSSRLSSRTSSSSSPQSWGQESAQDSDNFGTLPTTSRVPTVIRAVEVTNGAEAKPASIESSWKVLDTLNVGQECRVELTLTNNGELAAERVSVEVRLPESVKAIRATPPPVESSAFLGWKLPQLAGGETQAIRIVVMAQQPGGLELAAFVRHTSSSQISYTVTEPKLELALTGPEEVHVGEPASQTLIVRNPGTGIANNVRVEALIPEGLEHATGRRLQMDIGSLNPGEARSVRLSLGAVAGGDHILQVKANADAGLVQTAAAEVRVIAPSLKVGIAGPSVRYLGRDAEYVIRVLNDGAAPNDFVQVNHRIPDGFTFIRTDRGTKFDPATRILSWYVGRLESAEPLDLKVILRPDRAGEFVHAVRATSELGGEAEAQAATRVQGTASLIVEVNDLEDPVEVGSQTAYEVKITNEGTAAASEVGLTCEIPQGMTFLGATGPTQHLLQDDIIDFRPIVEIPPGKTVTFRVDVEGGVAGDHRFRCRLVSKSLTRPLFTEELTKFYRE